MICFVFILLVESISNSSIDATGIYLKILNNWITIADSESDAWAILPVKPNIIIAPILNIVTAFAEDKLILK
mgnify:CR=1 FL=1